MTRKILYLITAATVVMAMCCCVKEEDDYSLYYMNHTTVQKETTWNGWRIQVVSKLDLWFKFESKNFNGDKTFFFTYGNRTDSTVVRNIISGESISIGVNVVADEGNYTVNQTDASGSVMRYWIDYTHYSHLIRLWTDDRVVTETVSLPRRITSFDSFTVSRK